jgi:hypothetical protein
MLSRLGSRALKGALVASSRKFCSEVPPAAIAASAVAESVTKAPTQNKPQPNTSARQYINKKKLDPTPSRADLLPEGLSSASWVYLSGFSKFASRRDLLVTLGEFQPVKIDPCVNKYHQFTGVYALDFGTAEKAAEFTKHMNEQQKRAGGEVTVTQESWVRRTLTAASKHNVGHNTLRVELRSQQRVFLESVLSLFENYGVTFQDVQQVNIEREYSHFMVQFPSAMDAQRACAEFHNTLLGRDLVHIETYQF